MRTLPADLIALLESGEPMTPVRLIELHISPDPEYIWDGIGNLEWDGKTFRGVGDLVDVDPITETADIKASQISVELNCLDAIESFSELREVDISGRDFFMHYAFLDETGAIITVEEHAFSGRMDAINVRTKPGATRIRLTVVNALTFLAQSWGRLQTDASHQADYPGDTSRRFIPFIQDRKIVV